MTTTRHDLTSEQRKQMPLHRGAMKYFPDALMLVAALSLRADRKHSPDADPNDPERPQWVRDKSADHGDCLGRHQLDVGEWDPEMGLDFAVHVAWRALAQLQVLAEEKGYDGLIDWDWEPPVSEEARRQAQLAAAFQGLGAFHARPNGPAGQVYPVCGCLHCQQLRAAQGGHSPLLHALGVAGAF